MSLPILIVAYCAFIVLASLLGGWLPSLLKLTHMRIQLMMSLVSGIMLGIALLHMLPQAAENLPSMTSVAGAMLAGLLVMFFLLRVFHVHDHGSLDDDDCGHDHGHAGSATRPRLGWVGLYFGLAIHTLLDGVALSASAVADANHDSQTFALYGLGTFLAVLLHKPLDALAITSLMHAGGWTKRSQTMANFSYALMCPLGAILFWLGVSHLAAEQVVVGYALAFSAGFFLCIALGDLLPEVQFHSHDRLRLSAALLLGVAIAVGIEMTPSHDEHGSTHGHQHDDDRPTSLVAAISDIKEHGSEVSEAFQAGDPDAAHEALHELGHLLVSIPALADESAMSSEDRSEVKRAGKQLFDAYDKLDQLMHGKKEDKKKAAATYAEIEDTIVAATHVLDEMLPMGDPRKER